jgi:hypothetical protein
MTKILILLGVAILWWTISVGAQNALNKPFLWINHPTLFPLVLFLVSLLFIIAGLML